MRIVSRVKSVSQDSKCSFMLPPWMLMELLCNCKRLKARTYIRADTLHLLYKFHGLSFYSMWLDYDLQVLHMSITGPRSPSTGWRFWSCTGGCQLIRGGWSEKLGPDFLIALIFFEDLPWTNFSELYTRGGNPHRPVILGSKDGTTILLQKRALLLLFLGGQRIYPQVTNFGLACWFNNLEINWLC